MGDGLIGSKKSSKVYRNSRHREQSVCLGLRWSTGEGTSVEEDHICKAEIQTFWLTRGGEVLWGCRATLRECLGMPSRRGAVPTAPGNHSVGRLRRLPLGKCCASELKRCWGKCFLGGAGPVAPALPGGAGEAVSWHSASRPPSWRHASPREESHVLQESA